MQLIILPQRFTADAGHGRQLNQRILLVVSQAEHLIAWQQREGIALTCRAGQQPYQTGAG